MILEKVQHFAWALFRSLTLFQPSDSMPPHGRQKRENGDVWYQWETSWNGEMWRLLTLRRNVPSVACRLTNAVLPPVCHPNALRCFQMTCDVHPLKCTLLTVYKSESWLSLACRYCAKVQKCRSQVLLSPAAHSRPVGTKTVQFQINVHKHVRVWKCSMYTMNYKESQFPGPCKWDTGSSIILKGLIVSRQLSFYQWPRSRSWQDEAAAEMKNY